MVNKATGKPFKPRVFFTAPPSSQVAPRSRSDVPRATASTPLGRRRERSSLALALRLALVACPALARFSAAAAVDGHVIDTARALGPDDSPSSIGSSRRIRQRTGYEIVVFVAAVARG